MPALWRPWLPLLLHCMGKRIPPAPGDLCLRMERVASSLLERVRLGETVAGAAN